MNKQKILVTSALPYANGPIHFGHIAGAYLPADVFVRFHQLLKNDVVYICGTDEHGVAVTIGAQQAKRTPKEQVDIFHKVIKDIFKKFNINFDHFSRTTTKKHYDLSQKFFTELHDNGHIEDKIISQFYCSSCNRFLADRFIYGTCYLCGAENARGDECPECGAWLEPLKLKNAKCKICNSSPSIKKTRHWFLKLANFKEELHSWLDQHPYWKPNVLNVARRQIDDLESRPITRDMDWGIKVPLEEAFGKVLYVWFDAPIGYIDATMEWAEKINSPEIWKEYWCDDKTRIVNFIGKDNIPFHLLVWPAMIMGQTTKYTLAENIPANEFLNLEGKQFSKSEGWYIDLESFFQKYTSDQIRYTLAAGAPETKDSDFNWRDFQKYNNSDLSGVLGNLVNRLMVFTHKNFSGKIPAGDDLPQNARDLLIEVLKRKEKLSQLYDSYQLKKAAYEIIDIARLGNKFFDENKPWVLIKESKKDCGKILFTLFTLLEQLSVISWPVIPDTASKIFTQFGIKRSIVDLSWDFESQIASDGTHLLNPSSILFKKIEDREIEEENEKLNKTLKDKKHPAQQDYEKLLDEISFEDFIKLDLRVAVILQAEPVKKSNKLLKLQVDVGFERRQILAGIAKYFKPDQLIGKKVIIVANLKPRKLMGEISQGMVLAASLNKKLGILNIDNIEPGARVS